MAAPPPPPAAAAAGGAAAATGVGSTLDEPVLTTIMRDLRQVATKLRYVLLPAGRQSDTLKELRNWDLWGPLLLCLVLSILLSMSAPVGQASLVFASVFVIVWAGAAVVTVNAQLLGGQISFFQSVCVLGYCIFPLVLASLLATAWSNSVWRTILVLTALVWATRGAWSGRGRAARGCARRTRAAHAAVPPLCTRLVLTTMPAPRPPPPFLSCSVCRLHGRDGAASAPGACRIPDASLLHPHRVVGLCSVIATRLPEHAHAYARIAS